MNLADDISYGVHDFEDSLALNLVDGEAIETDIGEADFSHFLDDQKERYQEEKIEKKVFIDNLLGPDRKRYIGRLIHYFLTNIDILEKDFDNPLLKYRVTIKKEAQQLLDALKKLVRKEVIYSPNVQQLEFKGQRMVVEVFEILDSEPDKFLQPSYRERLKNEEQERVVCDYIAGMTDDYLLKIYERLCSPRMGSVFDQL